jgi:EpsI family protein
MIPRFLVGLVFIGLNLYVFRYFATTDYAPPRETFATFPMTIEGWRCAEPEEMAPNVHRRLGVTDYIICNYRRPETGALVNLYVGYHASQTRDVTGTTNMIHPPEHCLPGSGWDIIRNEVVDLDWIPGAEAKRVIIAKGNQRALVYFWYQSRGRVIARNYEKILYMFVDRATDRRTDGSLVRFTVPIENGDEEAAERTFRALAKNVTPLLSNYVPD